MLAELRVTAYIDGSAVSSCLRSYSLACCESAMCFKVIP